PNPLTIEIVLPLAFEGLLDAAVIYDTWDSTIDPGEKPNSGNYILMVSRIMDILQSYQENSTFIPFAEDSTS
ncbi:MAG: hypothetical protein LBH42_00570, partial [Treponema sp.]|nr:hypothetical protein [Treponema sp.]